MYSCCLTAQDPPAIPLVLFVVKGQILPHPMLPYASFPPDHEAWDWLLLQAAVASQGWQKEKDADVPLPVHKPFKIQFLRSCCGISWRMQIQVTCSA